MASTYLTVLEIINEVNLRMKVRTVSVTTANTYTKTLVSLLNDIIEDLCDFGEWNELQASAAFAMISGQGSYSMAVTANVTAKRFVHSVQEVRVSGRIPPLEPIADKNEGRMNSRTNSMGTPSRYWLDGTDPLGNPIVWVFPRPGSTQGGNNGYVKFQVLPPKYVPGTDDAVVAPFPGRVLVAGLVAAAVLDESGGAETQQYKTAQTRYMTLRNGALGRQTAKTGEFLNISPGLNTRS